VTRRDGDPLAQNMHLLTPVCSQQPKPIFRMPERLSGAAARSSLPMGH